MVHSRGDLPNQLNLLRIKCSPINTWNVHTMKDDYLQLIWRELISCKWYLFGLCESRWTGNGRMIPMYCLVTLFKHIFSTFMQLLTWNPYTACNAYDDQYDVSFCLIPYMMFFINTTMFFINTTAIYWGSELVKPDRSWRYRAVKSFPVGIEGFLDSQWTKLILSWKWKQQKRYVRS